MDSGRDTIIAGPGWEEAAESVRGDTVMVIGAPGSGKTHLARFVVDALYRRGRRVALITADMGQPSVGVPACMALALDAPWQKPTAMWFVGDVSPSGHMLPAVVGTARLAQRARCSGAEAVVIDTTGLVEGGAGRALKYHKALAAGVSHVMALQRGDGLHGDALEPLLGLLGGPGRAAIDRLSPAVAARERSAEERRAFRQEGFRDHLRDAAVQLWRRERLIAPDWSAGPASDGIGLPPGTIVGLLDRLGFCQCLGRFEDTRPGGLAVYAHSPDPAAVVWVQAGSLRLDRDGKELA